MSQADTLTRDFKESVIERVRRDPDFAAALKTEAARLDQSEESEAAHLILRDLING